MGFVELELLPSHHQLPPIRTAAAPPKPRPGGDGDDNAADDLDGGFATPKSAASVLPAAPSACPPAPRKPRPAAKRKLPTTHHRRGCNCACSDGSAAQPRRAPGERWFIVVPQDVLAAVFVPRPPSPPCPWTSPPARKKIRVHVVGS